MSYVNVAGAPVEPCRHPSYTMNMPGLPPGMARCSIARCGQVFLHLDLTQVCSDALYAGTELEARRLHRECAGYVVTPDARCECTCHGTRLVAPAPPTDVKEPVDGLTVPTIYEWHVGDNTVVAEPGHGLTKFAGVDLLVTSVDEVDQLMAALAGARQRLAQGQSR